MKRNRKDDYDTTRNAETIPREPGAFPATICGCAERTATDWNGNLLHGGTQLGDWQRADSVLYVVLLEPQSHWRPEGVR